MPPDVSPDTPAAMIQTAFWDGEHVVSGILNNIAAEVRRADVQPPATLVVGEVVRLRDKLKNLIASNYVTVRKNLENKNKEEVPV